MLLIVIRHTGTIRRIVTEVKSLNGRLISEHAAFDGVCNITAFYWVDDSCMRDSNFYFTYRVPIIEVGN